VEARNNGQTTIPVTIFPARLEEHQYQEFRNKYATDAEKLGLWADLKKSFDSFNATKSFLSIQFLRS